MLENRTGASDRTRLDTAATAAEFAGAYLAILFVELSNFRTDVFYLNLYVLHIHTL